MKMLFFIVSHFFLWQFVFGFQRVTLRIGRSLQKEVGLSVNQIQVALTPDWMGALGWVNSLLSILVCFLVVYLHGVAIGLLVIVMIYFGGYTLLSPLFDGLLNQLSHSITKMGLKGYKKSAGGYLIAWKIEEALQKGNDEK